MKSKEGIMKPIWQWLVLVTGWLVPSGVMAQERFMNGGGKCTRCGGVGDLG
jgi:hypothetical protein